MTVTSRWLATGACAIFIVGGCAGTPDHFYTLAQSSPRGESAGLAEPKIHVLLKVSIPNIVDRSEMILNVSDNGIAILEHERWATPFSDQVTETLALDLEARRSGLLVGDHSFDQPDARSVRMVVDIARMVAKPGRSVTLDARWHVSEATTSLDIVGGDSFTAPLEGADSASVAKGYGVALAALADRLSALPP